MVRASASRPDCQISGPAQRMERAVIVHTTSVSTNTSKQPYIPSLKGWSVMAVAWVMGEEPQPASLEKVPRAAPCRSASATVEPARPPTAGMGANA